MDTYSNFMFYVRELQPFFGRFMRVRRCRKAFKCEGGVECYCRVTEGGATLTLGHSIMSELGLELRTVEL